MAQLYLGLGNHVSREVVEKAVKQIEFFEVDKKDIERELKRIRSRYGKHVETAKGLISIGKVPSERIDSRIYFAIREAVGNAVLNNARKKYRKEQKRVEKALTEALKKQKMYFGIEYQRELEPRAVAVPYMESLGVCHAEIGILKIRPREGMEKTIYHELGHYFYDFSLILRKKERSALEVLGFAILFSVLKSRNLYNDRWIEEAYATAYKIILGGLSERKKEKEIVETLIVESYGDPEDDYDIKYKIGLKGVADIIKERGILDFVYNFPIELEMKEKVALSIVKKIHENYAMKERIKRVLEEEGVNVNWFSI